MTIAKVRGLSQFGVITDVDPFNLPPQAYSRGVNVRFKKLSVERAPVFRRIPVSLSQTGPRFLSSNLPSSGFDTLYIGYLNGRVSSYQNGTETDVSIFGYVNASSENPYTSCHLGNVFYVNRADRVPWSRRVTDSTFLTLANWDANWRTQILRSCGQALCAFNVTKSGINYPTMVKTSEFAQVNTVPASWDSTDPTTNATENILGEMEGPIVDAMNLGNGIVIYGYNECWSMIADGSFDVWAYAKLPFDGGAINTNCVVEVAGYHYVFGANDIWRHDGVSKESICDGVRDYIYNTMNVQKANRFFVFHDRLRKEIRFCYASGDALANFVVSDGCNFCAVYNLVEKTWTFDDLPYVYGAAAVNLDVRLAWNTVTQTWDTIAGTWLDQEDSLKRVTIMLGDVSAAYTLSESLYGVDQQGTGSLIPYPVDTHATQGWQLERDGLDLDELQEVRDNLAYKVCSSIYPQARLEAAAQPILFTIGGANNYNDIVMFADEQGYDGIVQTRIDPNISGRFLFLRIRHEDYHYIKLTGYDFDIQSLGSI